MSRVSVLISFHTAFPEEGCNVKRSAKVFRTLMIHVEAQIVHQILHVFRVATLWMM